MTGGQYGPDLAFIHDAGYGELARSAAASLVDLLRNAGIGAGLVVDIGCGSGILSQVLHQAGYDVLGVDPSPSFIELAKRRLPQGQFRLGTAQEFEVPPCVAVAAVGEVLSYCNDRGNTNDHGLNGAVEQSHENEQLERFFDRVHEALVPGGVFLFDMIEAGRVPPPGRAQHHRQSDGWAVLVDAEEDLAAGILSRRITSFVLSGQLYRRNEELHRQRLLPHRKVLEMLQRHAFHVDVLDAYGNRQLPPGSVAFCACKAR